MRMAVVGDASMHILQASLQQHMPCVCVAGENVAPCMPCTDGLAWAWLDCANACLWFKAPTRIALAGYTQGC